MEEMFEQTNQTDEMQMEEAQEFEESLLPQEDDGEISEDTQEIMQEAFALDVKYNGVEQRLSEDEARTYAQKGMNYDHVMEELTRLRNAPEAAIIQDLARKSGMSKEDFLNSLTAEVNLKQAVAQGADPDAAYLQYENQQLKSRIEAAQQNAYNKAIAPGSAASAGAGEETDPFLQAFLRSI